jgi:hypothetical protein
MLDNGVFEPVKMKISEIPKGTKLIDMTWAMKEKSNGTLRGRINVRGFRQIDGEHYDSTCISAPVTNAMSIKMALTLLIICREELRTL